MADEQQDVAAEARAAPIPVSELHRLNHQEMSAYWQSLNNGAIRDELGEDAYYKIDVTPILIEMGVRFPNLLAALDAANGRIAELEAALIALVDDMREVDWNYIPSEVEHLSNGRAERQDQTYAPKSRKMGYRSRLN